MALVEFLSEERAAILERWRQRVLETYPAETARFLGQTANPFANPVGATLSESLPALYDAVLGDGGAGEAPDALDALVKLRSVQDFSPSEALGFIFALKEVIREALPMASRETMLAREWPRVEGRIDALALTAFDAYAANRERMCEIKINAMKRRTFVLERAALGPPGGGEGDPG